MAIKKSSDEKEKGEDMPFKDEGKKGTVESPDMVVPKAAAFTPEQMEIIKDLQRQVEESKLNNNEVSKALAEEGYVDPIEDYLDVPSVFFAFSSWFAIYGDRQYNREVMPPREEAIKFKKLYRYEKNKGSRGTEVISVSQAIVRSKETAEWLRSHSLFNIKFFESIEKAQNVNVTLAEKMSEMNNVVSSMNDHSIIDRCKREGIPVSTAEVGILRKILTKKMAEDALKREKVQHKMTFENQELDEDGVLKNIERKSLGNVDADLNTDVVY